MSILDGWRPADLLPGVYLFFVALLLDRALSRWFDPLPGRVRAVFAVLLLVLFGEVLFGGGLLLPLDSLRSVVPFEQLAPPEQPGNFLQSDLLYQITPTLLSVRRAFGAGEWPLWEPGVASGMPLLADPQSQVLQPLVFLAAPFPTVRAAAVIAALRVLVALVFTFLFLARQGLGRGPSLLGSLAYGLGGFVLLWVGWPLANAAALLPVVLYALARCDSTRNRRDFLLLGIALWALLLAGQPEVIVYALALSGAFLLSRLRRRAPGRRLALLLPCGAAAALAVAAAAPALAPTAFYLPQTERNQAIAVVRSGASWAALRDQVTTAEGRERWAKRVIERLVPTAAPNAWGNNRYGAYWGSTAINQDAGGFVGSAALLLAFLSLFARRRFPAEGPMRGAALCGLLAVAQPPALSPLLLSIPVVGSTAIHANQRVMFVVGFSIAYLAACMAERLARGERKEIRRGAVLGIGIGLAALVTWAYLAHPDPMDPGRLAGFRHAWLAGQLAVLTATVLAVTLFPPRVGHQALPVVLAALTAVELLAAHSPANPPMPRRLAYPATPPLAFLLGQPGAAGGTERMAALGPAMPPNLASAYGLADIRVYNPMAPSLYEQALGPVLEPPDGGLPRLRRPDHPLYDLLGVRWLLTAPMPEMSPLPPPMRLAFRHEAGWVWERPGALQRIFLAATPDGWPPAAPAGSRLEVTRIAPAHLQARAALAERRLAVASLYQDGGWHLLTRGKPRETITAAGPFVAAWLTPEAGAAFDLDLLYRPRGFLGGSLAAAFALTLAGLWWVPPPPLAPARERHDRDDRDDGAHQDGGEELEEESGEVRQDVEAGLEG
jgi:hypothetical protein